MRRFGGNWNRDVSLQLNEAIVGGIIAVCIEAINALFFHHSPLGVAVAILVVVMGILLAIMRSTLREAFAETYEHVDQMAKAMDLSRKVKLAELGSLFREYMDIHEEDFRRVKEQIVEDASRKLHDLAANKRSPLLARNEYYAWLLPMLEKLGNGDTIQAVSTSSDAEWDDSPEEKRFLALNLAAAAAGCKVERIFVVKKNRLDSFLKIAAIDAHTVEAAMNLNGSIAYVEDLEKRAGLLLKQLGNGFLLINGRVGLIDEFNETGDVRGVVTMNSGELSRFKTMFEHFRLMTEPLRRGLLGGKDVGHV